MRGQGATNCIATTASEAKKGKGKTKEGFVAETLKSKYNLSSKESSFEINSFMTDLKSFKSSMIYPFDQLKPKT